MTNKNNIGIDEKMNENELNNNETNEEYYSDNELDDMMRVCKDILVNVTTQRGTETRYVVKANVLFFMSGVDRIKELDVIDWNLNQTEYREVA